MWKINLIVLTCVAGSVIACRKSDPPVVKDDAHVSLNATDVEAIESSRLLWQSSLTGLLMDKHRNIEITEEHLLKMIVDSTACDATYKYSGVNIDISKGIELLRHLYKTGMLNDRYLIDPLNVNSFYKRQPNDQAPALMANANAINNEAAYKAFCIWFNKQIK